MPQGLQIFDPNGNVIVDSSTFVMKEITMLTALSTAGTLDLTTAIPNPATIIPAVVVDPNASEASVLPRLSVGSKSVTWDVMRSDMPLHANLSVMIY